MELIEKIAYGFVFLLTLSACSVGSSKFTDPITPIGKPVHGKYLPYSGEESLTTTMSISGKSLGTTQAKCKVSVEKIDKKLKTYRRCRFIGKNGKAKDLNFTAQMSRYGKLTDIQFSPKFKLQNNLNEKSFTKLAEDMSLVINNPIKTGSIIFKLDPSGMFTLINKNNSDGGLIQDIVRGKSIYKGRSVFVTETIFIGNANIPGLGATNLRGTGYKLIDETTMAILESKITMYAEFFKQNKKVVLRGDSTGEFKFSNQLESNSYNFIP